MADRELSLSGSQLPNAPTTNPSTSTFWKPFDGRRAFSCWLDSWPSLQPSLSVVVMPLHESQVSGISQKLESLGCLRDVGFIFGIGDTQAPRGLGKVQVLGARPLRELEPLLDYAPQFGVKPSTPNGPGKDDLEDECQPGEEEPAKDVELLPFCKGTLEYGRSVPQEVLLYRVQVLIPCSEGPSRASQIPVPFCPCEGWDDVATQVWGEQAVHVYSGGLVYHAH